MYAWIRQFHGRLLGLLIVAHLILVSCSDEPQPTPESTIPTFEEFMASVEATMEATSPEPLPTPIPDVRYRGCHREVEEFLAATMNKNEDPSTFYLAGQSKKDIEEEYFEALEALGRCLGAQDGT